MPIYREDQLQEISKQFQIYGEILHAETCKIGHINETYSATYRQGGTKVRYIHQKINQNVFRDPVGLMSNVVRVTRHFGTKLEVQNATDITRRCLTIVPTRKGDSYYRDGERRMLAHVCFCRRRADVRMLCKRRSRPSRPAKRSGISKVCWLICRANVWSKRFPIFIIRGNVLRRLKSAVENDHFNRAEGAKKEIDFAMKHEHIVDVILEALAKKKIPERITHNDTKFNNVMLDAETGEAMCVVDLDTVMPGCALYDFGDMVRTTTSPTLEDERDLTQGADADADVQKVVRRLLVDCGQLSDESREVLHRVCRQAYHFHNRHAVFDRSFSGRHLFPHPSARS